MAECRGCGAEIVWAETPEGKRQPFDREPDPNGNRILLGRGPKRAPLAVPVGRLSLLFADGSPPHDEQDAFETAAEADVIYMPHHATCPDRDRFTKGQTE